MAIRGYLARILVDGFDLSGTSSGVVFAGEVGVHEYGTLQTAAMQKIPGNAAASIEHMGYFNGSAAGTLEKVLYDRLASTSTIYVTAALDTGGTIPVSYTLDAAWNGQLKHDGDVGELLALTGKWEAAAATVRGYQLWTGAIAATGAKTGVDFGAAGSAGGVAFVHITSVTGTATNAAIQIQCDDNASFTSATTLGTATFSGNSTTGLQALRVSLGTGTVDRYLRINVSSLGGATGFTAVVFAGVSGRTY